jgi:hypothetical protein
MSNVALQQSGDLRICECSAFALFDSPAAELARWIDALDDAAVSYVNEEGDWP